MSTTAVTPPVLAAKITAPAALTTQTWLQKHERLIIVAFIVALGAWGLQKHYDRAATLAEARATIADAHAATIDKTAAQSLAALQQALAEKNATNLMLAQQNAALAAAITSRQSAVIVQQKTDTTLAPAALASRIATLSNAPPAEVTLDGDSIRLGRNASVSVASALEFVPYLQKSLDDEKTIASNTQAELDNVNGLFVTQGTALTSCSAARKLDADKCTADIKQAKADGKKNSAKWFERGFIVGFVSGLWAGHAGL